MSLRPLENEYDDDYESQPQATSDSTVPSEAAIEIDAGPGPALVLFHANLEAKR